MNTDSGQVVKQNKWSMFLALLVVMILLAAVVYNGMGLYSKLRSNREKIGQLQEEIRQEEERAEQIETYRKFTKTEEFIEQIARDWSKKER